MAIYSMMIVSHKFRSSSDVITMNKKTLNVNLPCISRGWLRNSCRKIKRFYLKLRRRLRYKLQAKKNQFSWDYVTDKLSEFHFYISHNTPCLPPKFCISIVFNSLGTTVIPRRNRKQTLCKLMIMIMIMNLYSAKTIGEYSKALYIKLKLMKKQ